MEIIVRATIVYWFLWLVMRGIGKRELAEMSPFELILLITIGDLVQQAVTQNDFSLTGMCMAVGTFAFWVVVVASVQFKSTRIRRLVNGTARDRGARRRTARAGPQASAGHARRPTRSCP